nr:hypothetical protein [Chloracidobacterium thermophilum]
MYQPTRAPGGDEVQCLFHRGQGLLPGGFRLCGSFGCARCRQIEHGGIVGFRRQPGRFGRVIELPGDASDLARQPPVTRGERRRPVMTTRPRWARSSASRAPK